MSGRALLVLAGFLTGSPARLVFAPMELVAYALGLALLVPVLLDGHGNWLEGSRLLTCYLVLASVLWVI